MELTHKNVKDEKKEARIKSGWAYTGANLGECLLNEERSKKGYKTDTVNVVSSDL